MKTICNSCGTTSSIMTVGNGCHACQRGWMIEHPDRKDTDAQA